jgi:hypothetical protein
MSTPLPGNNAYPNPLVTNNRQPKHTRLHPAKFISEDKSLYSVFRRLIKAKLQTDAQAISREYEMVWYAFRQLEEKAAKRIYT